MIFLVRLDTSSERFAPEVIVNVLYPIPGEMMIQTNTRGQPALQKCSFEHAGTSSSIGFGHFLRTLRSKEL